MIPTPSNSLQKTEPNRILFSWRLATQILFSN